MATKKISVAGYEIGDITSLLALFAAVASIVWQLSDWWIGPDVKVLPPLRVEFACEDDNDCHENSHLMIVLDRLQFVNYGAVSYDMLVNPGTITVLFRRKDETVLRNLDLHALYFSNRTTAGIGRQPARFVLVKGGSVATHEVEYLPRRVIGKDGSVDSRNFMTFSEFKSLIAEDEGPRIIDLAVKPRPVGEASDFAGSMCRVIVDDDMVTNAGDPNVGTFPRDCLGT